MAQGMLGIKSTTPRSPAPPRSGLGPRVWQSLRSGIDPREPWAVLLLFLVPFATLTAVFGVWPIALSISLAFTEGATALGPNPRYIGFDNFATLAADPAFWSSLWRTVLYTSIAVLLNVTVALALSLLATHRSVARTALLLRLAVFLPVVTPEVASFIVLKWMVSQDFGLINAMLDSVGLPRFAGVTRPDTAFVTLLFAELWNHVGLYTIIFITNLQLLDPSINEAAKVDGATRWQRFRYVVLPQLRPAITINSVYALIEFLKTFTVVMVMTKGGPAFSTSFLSYYAYTKFENAQYGQATAVAMILFLIVFVLAMSLNYYHGRREIP
jgi:ABC-type sugar transport system permease subunit